MVYTLRSFFIFAQSVLNAARGAPSDLGDILIPIDKSRSGNKYDHTLTRNPPGIGVRWGSCRRCGFGKAAFGRDGDTPPRRWSRKRVRLEAGTKRPDDISAILLNLEVRRLQYLDSHAFSISEVITVQSEDCLNGWISLLNRYQISPFFVFAITPPPFSRILFEGVFLASQIAKTS